MSEIAGAMADVTTLVGDIFTLLASNWYLSIFLAVGLFGVGALAVRLLKGAIV